MDKMDQVFITSSKKIEEAHDGRDMQKVVAHQ